MRRERPPVRSEGAYMRSVLFVYKPSVNPTTHHTLAHGLNNKTISKNQTKLKVKQAYDRVLLGREPRPVRGEGAYMHSVFV